MRPSPYKLARVGAICALRTTIPESTAWTGKVTMEELMRRPPTNVSLETAVTAFGARWFT